LASSVVNNVIYVFGGNDNNNYFNTVEAFDILSPTLTRGHAVLTTVIRNKSSDDSDATILYVLLPIIGAFILLMIAGAIVIYFRIKKMERSNEEKPLLNMEK